MQTFQTGERALEQLNYSLIKNRAWLVSLILFHVFPLSTKTCPIQPDHVVSA